MYALIDIDGVIADLHTVWLNIYNTEWNDTLTPDQIIDWNTAQFVKPECGVKVYEIIERPEIYDYILPIPKALEGLQKLRDVGFEIIYATIPANGTEGIKYKWLNKHEFWNDKDHYFETRKSKFLIKNDLMIDDNPTNFNNYNGFKIIFDRPWNRKYDFKNRMLGWQDIINTINKYNTWKSSQLIPV